jgi:hypothetical protein
VARKLLFGSKIDKIIVVCPDFKGVGMSFKVMMEGFKGTNDGEEFFIMNVIILFGGEE